MTTSTLLTPAQWAQTEFALAELGDRRRMQRLVKMASALAHCPGGTLPQAFSEGKELKAAYRFLSQPQASSERILSPHWARTRRACQEPGEYWLRGYDGTGLHPSWGDPGLGLYRRWPGPGPAPA